MLGGMSWESTASYYRLLNQGIQQKLGGLHSAKLILHSVDFDEIEKLQHDAAWNRMGVILANAAYGLEKAGAEGIIICTNTMHKLSTSISTNINIPLLHIADATAEKLIADGVKKVGLLGTAFTMEEEFYKGRLSEKFALEVITPDTAQREVIHKVIYEELCLGITEDTSREYYTQVIASLAEQGAEAVILGCTEIGLLISQADSPLPIYDTTLIHADAAIQWMLDT
jgi:aspartate racemase